MDKLRLWILLVGLAVIAGIYGWGKYHERRVRRHERERVEPVLGDLPEDALKEWEAPHPRNERSAWLREALTGERPGGHSGTASSANGGPAHAKPRQELIIAVSLMAPQNRLFNGVDLLRAFEMAGLVYGDMHIFHAPLDMDRADRPGLFSVANAVEPGTLDPDKIRLGSTPGLVIFARLPGPIPGTDIYDHIQATARFLAVELGGEVCDERRQPLTVEKVQATRGRIISTVGDATSALEPTTP